MRTLAMAARPFISCLALALLGCTGHDTYETYYVDGGSSSGAPSSRAAGGVSGGANASAGSGGQAGASAGSNGRAGADNQAGTRSAGGGGGTLDGTGGTAGEVGATGGSAGSTGGSAGASGQPGSPGAGEAGSADAAECLRASDCRSGMSCSAIGQCVSEPCTDVDCGGACPPCSDGRKCKVDSDCTSYACDAALHTCAADQCQDHEQDGLETDTDCGGGLCTACALGKSCLLSPDCASQACDGVTLICVSDVCSDHRKDGNESDADCGGGTCDQCSVGKKCRNSFDCTAGHVCAVSKVCE